MAENGTTEESFSFVETEKEVLNFWKTNQIFQKSLEQSAARPPYIFYDGPPFATGLPHHGHIVASTLKDIVPRYFTMKGFHVKRRFGWDCHGLPIEHEIDKKLGMSAHDAVKKFGVSGYNKECRAIVLRYTAEWEKTITRLGRWIDFENDYKTMDANFMESVWWVFKELWNKDLIYQGSKVVPFSTSLGTVVSNFEANLNYMEVQDPAVTVLMKSEVNDYYFAAWTTTPWTLPANLGLCMGADIDYLKVKDEDKDIVFILAKERFETYAKKHHLKIISEHKGKDFLGETYEPLFPYFKELKSEGAFKVFNDDYVTTDSGTGIVHTAPGFGEDDNRVFREAGVEALVCPVDDAGKFTDEITDYRGIYVKEADKQIIKDLKAAGKMYEQATIVHSYPFCWRSDTPLIYKSIPSWYVRVEKIKEQLIAANQQIHWVPEHIKDGRFGKWLEGARDWAISRNRVWGTPLPIWTNDQTGNHICVGSIKELEELTGTKVSDLHREYVDELTFIREGEEGTYRRIVEVLDCWFESGSMPYAQLHYPFENKEVFEAGFPAAFIAEGLDQTRGWFYTINILSTAIFNKPAFKNVIVNGMVLAADGKKMSKRLKNYTEPDLLMNQFGADALRLALINSPLVKAEELKFTDDGVKDMVRRALLPWYNSFKFFKTYAEVDGWNPEKHLQYGDNIVDKWILSKLQTLIKNVNDEMKEYHLYNVVPQLFHFIEDLTNWYIRLNRRRYWEEGSLSEDKQMAFATLYTTVKTITVLMAPFAPFLSEYIFQELKKLGGEKTESVHLCSYPETDAKWIDPTLEDAVNRMQEIILLGRQKRNQKQIKVKTPLATLTILHKDQAILNEIKKLEVYIKTELNVKEVNYSTNEEEFIKLYAKPNSPILGKRLGKTFGKYVKQIQSLQESSLRNFEAGETVTIDGEKFKDQDLLIYREAKDGTEALSNRWISINLDCKLNKDLLGEGLAREIVNRIQKTRKELNFNVSDRIQITYRGDESLVNVLKKHQDYIGKETLCENFAQVKDLKKGHSFEIDDGKITFELSRIN